MTFAVYIIKLIAVLHKLQLYKQNMKYLSKATTLSKCYNLYQNIYVISQLVHLLRIPHKDL